MLNIVAIGELIKTYLRNYKIKSREEGRKTK